MSLTKGNIEGIRLIADLFVINDLKAKVLKEHLSEEHMSELIKRLESKVPDVFEAGEELKKQISEVRQTWLEMLMNDDNWGG